MAELCYSVRMCYICVRSLSVLSVMLLYSVSFMSVVCWKCQFPVPGPPPRRPLLPHPLALSSVVYPRPGPSHCWCSTSPALPLRPGACSTSTAKCTVPAHPARRPRRPPWPRSAPQHRRCCPERQSCRPRHRRCCCPPWRSRRRWLLHGSCEVHEAGGRLIADSQTRE